MIKVQNCRKKPHAPRVQRKLIFQLALWASCNQHLLARKSFLLAPKNFSRVFFKICFYLMHPSDTYSHVIPRLVYADFTSSERLSVRRNLKHLSYSSFGILILRKIFTCPSGRLSTEFTSTIPKSTSPGLSDTTFFARWIIMTKWCTNDCYCHDHHFYANTGSYLLPKFIDCILTTCAIKYLDSTPFFLQSVCWQR